MKNQSLFESLALAGAPLLPCKWAMANGHAVDGLRGNINSDGSSVTRRWAVDEQQE
ncbi:MAG: hypothetical protein IKH19_03680 [Muribaculaceae bacterium]|nr:hypothetical protein [Muribaculaceae bacterium]